MARAGISSACFYPLTTEESFLKLCKAGVKCIELFFNSPSEMSDGFISDLKNLQTEYEIEIPSVHPFMSFSESFFLFSSYERRFYDILDFYKRFFEIMNVFGSEIFVLHGLKLPGSITQDVYFDRFHKLVEIGKEYNVCVCQENVVLHHSQSPDFLVQMKNALKDDFSLVLDIKQARRATESPYDFINKLGSNIKHVHISDYNAKSSCRPPCEGLFDFNEFFAEMVKHHDSGQLKESERFLIQPKAAEGSDQRLQRGHDGGFSCFNLP